jgi:uncharacterized protein YegP (UPF0339 family)
MYFEIVSASGGVRLNIKGDDNEIMLQSEVYESKDGAQNAIEEIQSGASAAPVKATRPTRVRATTPPTGGMAEQVGAESLPAPLDRVLTFGLAVALTGVVIQTLVHLLNAAFVDSPQLDASAEGNAMTWASSVAIFAVAFAATLHAVLLNERRRTYALIACVFAFFSLDEAILVHERLAEWVLAALGQDISWDSVVWPALYLPLAGTVVVLLVALARTAPARARRFVIVGLVLLVTAVAAEVLSAPVSTGDTTAGWVHVFESAYEEGAELMGWIMIATGLTVSTLTACIQPVNSRQRRSARRASRSSQGVRRPTSHS